MSDNKDKIIEELEKENKELREMSICKRCGFDNAKQLEVDPTLIKEYYKKLLLQEPFTKEYSLINDHIQVVCEETNRRLITTHSRLWETFGASMSTYAADILTLMYVKSISYKTEEGIKVKYEATEEDRYNLLRGLTPATIDDLIPEFFQKTQHVVLTGIKRAVSEFNTLCLLLAEETQDANFWKGAGLV